MMADNMMMDIKHGSSTALQTDNGRGWPPARFGVRVTRTQLKLIQYRQAVR